MLPLNYGLNHLIQIARILLKHYEIDKRLVSHHKFNEHKTLENITGQLQSGLNIALITDAGTPAISDPGFLLVRACVEKEIEVDCLPGATAFIPALVNSGLPNDKFCFEGFLPQKKGRQKRIGELAEEKRTIVFYESPFRLVKTMEQLLELWGEERKASVSREISKLHEETVRGTFTELILHYKTKPPKGEIVLIVEGKK